MQGSFVGHTGHFLPDCKWIYLNSFISQGSDKYVFTIKLFYGVAKFLGDFETATSVQPGGATSDHQIVASFSSHFIPFYPILS
jgi:hypothetical protein